MVDLYDLQPNPRLAALTSRERRRVWPIPAFEQSIIQSIGSIEPLACIKARIVSSPLLLLGVSLVGADFWPADISNRRARIA